MPIMNFSAGNPAPDANDFNTFLIQQAHAVKSSNTSRASTTTPSNDPHLFLTVSANTKYHLEMFLRYTGPTAADIDLRFSVPSGTTLDWCTDALGSGAANTTEALNRNQYNETSTNAILGTITGSDTVAFPKGVLRVGGTSGVFRCLWAQDVSNATSCTIYAGSLMMLRRMI